MRGGGGSGRRRSSTMPATSTADRSIGSFVVMARRRSTASSAALMINIRSLDYRYHEQVANGFPNSDVREVIHCAVAVGCCRTVMAGPLMVSVRFVLCSNCSICVVTARWGEVEATSS
jgi:hypothetical protein